MDKEQAEATRLKEREELATGENVQKLSRLKLGTWTGAPVYYYIHLTLRPIPRTHRKRPKRRAKGARQAQPSHRATRHKVVVPITPVKGMPRLSPPPVSDFKGDKLNTLPAGQVFERNPSLPPSAKSE